ncbi:MAG: isoprenylcysteine carboxylmethyltransferase family protein [Bacteroidetes bacterium]|nr:MAG: isoprenylcysteine carboxylmethyltransferase family protein [Bacteroidota bacterium]
MNRFEIFPLISFLILIFMISGRVFFLKRKGVKISSASKKAVKTSLFIYPVFLVIMFLWLLEISKPVFQISFSVLPETITRHLFNSNFIQVAGVVIIAMSLIIMFLTLLHFRNSLRFGLDENNRGKLITSGIFAISRNPFFTSLLIWFTGIALVFPSPFFIAFTILATAGIHIFILKEEKFLGRVYGEEYLTYQRKVPRYF